MTSVIPESTPHPGQAGPHRSGALALILQEVFTVAIRLRANRQVAADAQSFRDHVKQLLSAADREARRAGYDGEHIKLAIYAFIAFLDESVLNSNQPMFASWPRQPLQEEVFGDHVAGENFFRHLEELLGRQDSADLADVLEVYLLCLLLGFRGRFGIGDRSGLQGFVAAAQEKVLRIRGAREPFSPSWALPQGEVVAPPRDRWLPRLGILAATTGLGAALAFLLFRLSLSSGIAELQTLTSRLIH